MKNSKPLHNFLVNLDYDGGKLLFKNAAGIKNNLKGIKTSLLKKKIIPDISSSEFNLATEFAERGYVTLTDLYDPDLINRIANKFNEIIDDEKYSFPRATHNGKIYSRGLYRGFEFIPESIKLINEKVIGLLEKYYKSHFKVNLFLFSRNYHVPKEVIDKHEIYANRWHCDYDDSTFVKMNVYLTDVTGIDGPFHIQPKKRTKELMKKGFGNRDNYNLPVQVLENPKYVWKTTGVPGTTFLCNCQMGLHRAGIPENGRYRDLIQFQFGPSNKPLTKDWIKDFEDPYEPIKKNKFYNKSLRHRNA